MTTSFVHKALFPAPNPPSYTLESFPEYLISIPCDDEKGRKTMKCAALPALFMPYGSADLMIIYSHGNGCDIGQLAQVMVMLANKFKAHILVYEYPGYGVCGGETSEAGFNVAIETTFKFVREELRWPSERIVLYGQSIGTGPTCYLAAQLNQQNVSLAGVFLQSPFTSICEVVSVVATQVAGSLAAKMAKAIVTNRWLNIKQVEHIHDPFLVVHGLLDTLIPATMGEAVFEACPSSCKQLQLCEEATHNSWHAEEDIIEPVLAWLGRYARSPGWLQTNNRRPTQDFVKSYYNSDSRPHRSGSDEEKKTPYRRLSNSPVNLTNLPVYLEARRRAQTPSPESKSQENKEQKNTGASTIKSSKAAKSPSFLSNWMRRVGSTGKDTQPPAPTPHSDSNSGPHSQSDSNSALSSSRPSASANPSIEAPSQAESDRQAEKKDSMFWSA